MGIELQILAWAIALGLVQLVIAASLNTSQRGLAWGAGPRDEPPAPVSTLAGRMERAYRNFLETFPFFAAAVLLLVATQKGDANSAMGAQIYFWARVVYVPAYAMGINFVRTIVWFVSMVGLVMVLLPQF